MDSRQIIANLSLSDLYLEAEQELTECFGVKVERTETDKYLNPSFDEVFLDEDFIDAIIVPSQTFFSFLENKAEEYIKKNQFVEYSEDPTAEELFKRRCIAYTVLRFFQTSKAYSETKISQDFQPIKPAV